MLLPFPLDVSRYRQFTLAITTLQQNRDIYCFSPCSLRLVGWIATACPMLKGYRKIPHDLEEGTLPWVAWWGHIDCIISYIMISITWMLSIKHPCLKWCYRTSCVVLWPMWTSVCEVGGALLLFCVDMHIYNAIIGNITLNLIPRYLELWSSALETSSLWTILGNLIPYTHPLDLTLIHTDF